MFLWAFLAWLGSILEEKGKNRPDEGAGNWLERHVQGIVWVVIGTLTLLVSASHVVMYGEKVLYELPLPGALYRLWSIFRASGRLIWPLVYSIVLGAVCMNRKKIGRKTADLMLLVCLVLQFVDIRGMLVQKNEVYNQRKVYQTLLPSKDWEVIGTETGMKHICFVSDMVSNRKQLFSFGDYASDYGLTLSNFYFARSFGEKEQEAREKALAECPPDTLFVFFGNEAQKCLSYPLNYYAIDGLVVGCSEPLDGLDPLPADELTVYRYDMESGRFLNNAEVTEEGWLVHSYGNSYGPYLFAGAGRYRVSVSGSNLTAVDVKCYYRHGDVNLEPQNFVVEENHISYEVELTEWADDLEFALWNIGGSDMIVDSVVIEKVQ